MSDALNPPLTDAEQTALRRLFDSWPDSDGADEAAAAVRLIRAAERERNATVCDSRATSLFNQKPHPRISEAGEASKCASAIRGSIAALRGAPEEGTDGK